jgi:aerobic-type carbon monoxide dehydrogenase small subunit (CoxS/CutS family)
MNETRCLVNLTVNGQRVSKDVPVRMHLVDFLREELGLTGSHLGCEHGVCGACSLFVNGKLIRGCLVLVAQLEGAEVSTIEGLSESGELDVLQQAFLKHNPKAGRDEIREYISGNYCRCTGYQAIVDAVESVIAEQGIKQGVQ